MAKLRILNDVDLIDYLKKVMRCTLLIRLG